MADYTVCPDYGNRSSDLKENNIPVSKYVRLPDLQTSRNEGTYKKVMAKYANPLLLIIDE